MCEERANNRDESREGRFCIGKDTIISQAKVGPTIN